MVVKKSLENHYGMKPGAIMHFMIAEYDLSFDLWEDGFDEISNAVEAALKASGRTPSVLYPKVSLDRAVRACFGRLDGFENDVEPQPRTIPDYDEGDLIGMEEIGAEPRNAG
jgi:hypothetical protein